jgi:hypothetical protein
VRRVESVAGRQAGRQAGGQLGANRVVSVRFPLFNSYYLQACGEWLEGSTRAVGSGHQG